MNVITLSMSDFSIACKQLQRSVTESGFIPDLVIGIATGGLWVLEQQDFDSAEKFEVSLKRDSSHRKESLGISRILKLLPYFLLNWMRVIEFRIMQYSDSEEIIDEKVKWLSSILEDNITRTFNSVLIVDDAVDSGVTLKTVYEAVGNFFGGDCDIKTASVVVTRKKPIIYPDYFLYNDCLLRFPWSNDYKGKDL